MERMYDIDKTEKKKLSSSFDFVLEDGTLKD